MTSNYYADHFNLTAREAIALMEGAHSFGKFNKEVSMMKYSWTRHQNGLLNNQMFRQISFRPQYFLNCNDETGFDLVGDAWGQIANTTWVCNALGMSKNGGPFHWFHRYNRCPASNECAAIDVAEGRAEPDTPPGCCQDLEPGMQCQPDCQRDIQNDETAMGSDLGFYLKFDVDESSGRPSGCSGFNPKWLAGKQKVVYPNCEKQDYAPQGEPLFAIVEDYADNAQKWFDMFVETLAKMSSNGYASQDLNSITLDYAPPKG